MEDWRCLNICGKQVSQVEKKSTRCCSITVVFAQDIQSWQIIQMNSLIDQNKDIKVTIHPEMYYYAGKNII